MYGMKTRSELQRDFLLAFGAFVIALVLWQFSPLSPVVYPLRLFVTFIHELGHGTAAILTGGEFLKFEVKSNGAGLAYSRGGLRPIVISAGYVGTAVFGAGLLFAANRLRRPQRAAIGLGGAFVGLTLLFSGLGLSNFNLLEALLTLIILGGAGCVLLRAQTPSGKWLAAVAVAFAIVVVIYFAAGDHVLTVVVGILSGLALMALGIYGEREPNLFVLNFLAFVVGLNAITDAWVLLQIVSNSAIVPQNDATSMAQETAFSATFWALIWIGLAMGLLGAASWLAFVRPLRSAAQVE